MDKHKEGLLVLLLESGCHYQAVKLYQEETGARLDDARRAVRQVAREHRLPTGRFISPATLAVLLALLIGVLLAF